MKEIIYLTLNQKAILDEAGVGVGSITWDYLRKILTDTDYWRVERLSGQLRSKGFALDKLGLGWDEDDLHLTYELAPGEDLNVTDQYILHAKCSNKDTIVLWEEVPEPYNTNNMFRQSTINVVMALSAALGFQAVKHTQPFKNCIVNY